MKRLLVFALCMLTAAPWPSAAQNQVENQVQDPPASQTISAKAAEVLQRESSGHSPSDDEVAQALTVKPAPTPAELQKALPTLSKLLESRDTPARSFALNLIASLESAPAAATLTADAPPTPSGPAAFPAPIAKVLTPLIPQVAARLTDELSVNQSLAATLLGGFSADPPPTVFPPLYAYLRRDDAVVNVGTSVVQTLLQLGPLAMESAVAIGRYLRRSDQTPNSRSNLVDALSGSQNQSQPLNKTLVEYLGSDDASLRARLILSLPQLDLAPDVFADTRGRVAQIVDNVNENLQVIAAAKAVAPCWTSTKMAAGCPVYQ